MRGPGLRVLCDVRRTWECPQCSYRRHVPQTETTVRCQCTKEQPLMKLVEGLRKVRAERVPLDPYMEFDLEDAPTTTKEATTKAATAAETTTVDLIEAVEVVIEQNVDAPATTPPVEASSPTPEAVVAPATIEAPAQPESAPASTETDPESADPGETTEASGSDGDSPSPKKRKRGRRRRRKKSGGEGENSPPEAPPTP